VGRSASLPRTALSGQPPVSLLVMTVLCAVILALVAPVPAHAQDGQIRLALLPVGQAGSFFDLTMRPGETRSLEVEIANDGEAPLLARTYAADVYTIINGGFGARLRDEPPSGTTKWLDYPTDLLQLPVGHGIRRTFAVAVPADALPGEYITSVVLENQEPFHQPGALTLNQVVRQAVAVVITVAGQRSPGLEIGKASHKVVAGISVVAVAVENTGNVRLKPLVSLVLVDATGKLVSQTTVPMDTFYAHTATFVEMQLGLLLPAGTYAIQLAIADEAQGLRVADDAIPLVVEAAPDATNGVLQVPGGSLIFDDAGVTPAVWIAITLAGLALAVAGAAIIRARRRDSRAGA
jgi:hypothetical protein